MLSLYSFIPSRPARAPPVRRYNPLMRRFRRWVFNSSAGLSFLLSALIVALWVRSYLAQDTLFLPGSHRVFDQSQRCSFALRSQRGGVTLDWSWGNHGLWLFRTSDDPWDFRPGLRPHAVTRWEFLDFAYLRCNTPTTMAGNAVLYPESWVRVPYWSLVAILSILPICWATLLRQRRSHRLRPNLCPVCSYDLRATPDRCPECGAVPLRAPRT
jgi:hypothetical protein